jgi:hypothetical protein
MLGINVLIIGIGRRSAISMSNTKKINAKRKKRNENGIRDRFLGSKPHSKGAIFSRSMIDREHKIMAPPNVANTRNNPMIKEIIIIVINRK